MRNLMSQEAEVIKKICLIGTGEVGKTSLIKRFILDIFDDKYLKTLGTKVSKKELDIKHPQKDLNMHLTLLIWDIMGQATFRTLLQDSYYFGAAGALAVCDSTRSSTLESLEEWIQSLYRVVGEKPIIILANKCDLEEKREIDEEMLKEMASKYNTSFLFTSARSGENVEQAFIDLGKLIIK
jgi:small GTP-binding protein